MRKKFCKLCNGFMAHEPPDRGSPDFLCNTCNKKMDTFGWGCAGLILLWLWSLAMLFK